MRRLVADFLRVITAIVALTIGVPLVAAVSIALVICAAATAGAILVLLVVCGPLTLLVNAIDARQPDRSNVRPFPRPAG